MCLSSFHWIELQTAPRGIPAWKSGQLLTQSDLASAYSTCHWNSWFVLSMSASHLYRVEPNNASPERVKFRKAAIFRREHGSRNQVSGARADPAGAMHTGEQDQRIGLADVSR